MKLRNSLLAITGCSLAATIYLLMSRNSKVPSISDLFITADKLKRTEDRLAKDLAIAETRLDRQISESQTALTQRLKDAEASQNRADSQFRINVILTIILVLATVSTAGIQLAQTVFDTADKTVALELQLNALWNEEYNDQMRFKISRIRGLEQTWTPAQTNTALGLLADQYVTNKPTIIRSNPQLMSLIAPDMGFNSASDAKAHAKDFQIVQTASAYRTAIVKTLNLMETISNISHYEAYPQANDILHAQYTGIIKADTKSVMPFINAYRVLNPRRGPDLNPWQRLTSDL